MLILISIIIAQLVGAYFLKDSVQNYYTDSNRKEMGSPGFFLMIMIAILHLVFFGMLVLDVFKNMGFDFIRAYGEHSGFAGFLLGLFLFVVLTPNCAYLTNNFPNKKGIRNISVQLDKNTHR